MYHNKLESRLRMDHFICEGGEGWAILFRQEFFSSVFSLHVSRSTTKHEHFMSYAYASMEQKMIAPFSYLTMPGPSSKILTNH